MADLIEFTDDNFDGEVINATGAVLVDFWAPWCGPCRQMNPMIEEIATENESLKVGKVNIDESPATSGKYKVMSIPTLIVFRNGEETQRFVGLQAKSRVQDAIDTALAST